MSILRREVLSTYKQLHRTSQKLFDGDNKTLNEFKKQILEKFRANKNESNPDEIKKMVQLARDVDVELRTTVIQAVKINEGPYQLRITNETSKLDNVMYNPELVSQTTWKNKPKNSCCKNLSESSPASKD